MVNCCLQVKKRISLYVLYFYEPIFNDHNFSYKLTFYVNLVVFRWVYTYKTDGIASYPQRSLVV